jgi:hypothetical protein
MRARPLGAEGVELRSHVLVLSVYLNRSEY